MIQKQQICCGSAFCFRPESCLARTESCTRRVKRAKIVMRWEGLGVLLALLLLCGCHIPPAGPFTVTSTADTVDSNAGNGVCADASGDCTLRAAIMEANALPGANIITLPARTYTLTIPETGEDANAKGDLDIKDDLIINGAGAAVTIIDGGGLDRVIHVVAGSVTLSGVTITGGNQINVAGGGGGIFNAGTLTLNNCIVTGNHGGNGVGGIYNAGGTLTLNNSTVTRNTAGGIGGIRNSAGTAILNNSTVSGNSAIQNIAGGILNDCSGGGADNDHIIATMTLNNSTVSGNSAGSYGGGIVNFSFHNRGCSGATVTLNNSTASGNRADGDGGGIIQDPRNNNPATITLKNSIVANNLGSPSANCSGTITSLGHNLSSDGTCGLSTALGDLPNTPSMLGPLASNGGPTETHALLPGSPAIDAGSGDCPPPGTDQRGVARPQPQGAACDIGAYEATSACVAPPSGMVAWWPLNETSGASFEDIIGGNNATLFASPLGAPQAPQPVSGKVKGAIHFPKFGNGLSGARVTPHGALASVGSADFTMDAWVQFETAPAGRPHYIVNKFDATSSKGYALYIISPGTTGNERLEFHCGDGTNISTVQSISILTPSQWHHVAASFARGVSSNALDIRLYVDGVQQGHQVGSPPGLGSLVNFIVLAIGTQPSTIDEPITIDALDIFNRALSQSEISNIFKASSAGKCRP